MPHLGQARAQAPGTPRQRSVRRLAARMAAMCLQGALLVGGEAAEVGDVYCA